MLTCLLFTGFRSSTWQTTEPTTLGLVKNPVASSSTCASHTTGDPRLAREAQQHGVPCPFSSAMQSARAVFDKYDTNRDGVLDQDEVAAMIDSIGYEVDASYVGGVMEIFGKFDTDRNGTIELAEFPQLWEHLGGEALVMEQEAIPESLPVVSKAATIDGSKLSMGSSSAAHGAVHMPDSGSPPAFAETTELGVNQGAFDDKQHSSQPLDQTEPQPVSSAQVARNISQDERHRMVNRLRTFRREQARVIAPPALPDKTHKSSELAVVVSHSASPRHGQLGRCISRTSSKRFAIVQFDGELGARPVKEQLIRAYHPEEAAAQKASSTPLAAQLALTSPSSDTASSAVAEHSVAALAEGDLVQVVDKQSPLFGERGWIVSLTPSGSFLVVKFPAAERPRPLRSEAVSRCYST